MCTQCGYNLSAERAVAWGLLGFDPREDAAWDGRKLGLSRQQREIVGGLIHARGRVLSRALVADRIGYEGDDGANVVDVQVCRIRALLRAAGAPRDLIQSIYLRGLRLNVEILNGAVAC